MKTHLLVCLFTAVVAVLATAFFVKNETTTNFNPKDQPVTQSSKVEAQAETPSLSVSGVSLTFKE